MNVALSPLVRLAEALNAADAASTRSLLDPQATWVLDGESQPAIDVLQGWLPPRAFARIHLRRAFADADDPHWWAGEWVFRISTDGHTWQEVEQGVIAHTQGERIIWIRLHSDPSTLRTVTPETPLRPELMPANLPQPVHLMSREEKLALHFRHTRAGWASGNADVVVSCHAPQSFIQTPLEVVRGHEALRQAVHAYAENYADTTVEVHHVVHNGAWLAIQQTWTCTNRKTGVRASDQDLNIGIVQDGVFYRWREYYDSRTSAQTREQTVFGHSPAR